MQKGLLPSLVAACAISMIAGCATFDTNDYAYSEARVEQSVAYGGIGGNAIEHRLTQHNGDEIVVRLDDGRLVAITQGENAVRVGERVRVLSGPRGSRVEPA